MVAVCPSEEEYFSSESAPTTKGEGSDLEASGKGENKKMKEAGSGEEELPRTSSALRSSIARYGTNSYYYAHAPLPGSKLDDGDVKVLEGPGVVTGGSPVLLGRRKEEPDESGADCVTLEEAAATAAQGKRLKNFRPLNSYMWHDDGKTVRVYIPLDKLPESEDERQAEPCFSSDHVAFKAEEETFGLVIRRKAGNVMLVLNKLYQPVQPQQCRVSVKDTKISIALVKDDPDLTWFSLTRSR
ncbi:cs domain protein [Cystoisospora suis]|uniref:Cs domain protein n=1 Tax=Cystoisospora suis TaxID=483139 RepID=A0A2C6L2Q4_9APIC|nr:cs domain protein [Cystoisospora suis]